MEKTGFMAGNGDKRVLFIASAGGHWIQLSRLATAMNCENAHYATTLDGAKAPTGNGKVTVVPDASRSDLAKLVTLTAKMVFLMVRVRPDVVITTGAAPGLMALCVGKLFRAKTVWIDSLANCEVVSLSGRMAKKYADLWLTQWPHLEDSHPGLRYMGSVL